MFQQWSLSKVNCSRYEQQHWKHGRRQWKVWSTSHFNSRFPGESWLAHPHWFPSSGREPSGSSVFFCGCHPTMSEHWKKNSRNWPQPVAWPHPFFIHHQTSKEGGVGSFSNATTLTTISVNIFRYLVITWFRIFMLLWRQSLQLLCKHHRNDNYCR